MPDPSDPAITAPGFDPTAEAAHVAERLIRRSAGLVDAADPREIVSALCDTLTLESSHLRLVWTWFGDRDAVLVEPQLIAGPAAGYARDLRIDNNPMTARGPAYRALQGERPPPTRIDPASPFAPWRRAAGEFGIRSVLALPLGAGAENPERGIFVLYADRDDYFDAVGVGLFDSIAALVGSLLGAARHRQALRATARSDALTGLGNRHMVVELERAMFRSSDAAPHATVLLLDLDHFKSVNDLHGHDVGDRVLREVAQLLRQTVRASDCVLRWGGEEFLVCLPDTGLDQGALTAEKIRARLATAALASGLIHRTVSIGLAELTVRTPLSSAIRHADEALYRAKRSGRNCVRVWTAVQ